MERPPFTRRPRGASSPSPPSWPPTEPSSTLPTRQVRLDLSLLSRLPDIGKVRVPYLSLTQASHRFGTRYGSRRSRWHLRSSSGAPLRTFPTKTERYVISLSLLTCLCLCCRMTATAATYATASHVRRRRLSIWPLNPPTRTRQHCSSTAVPLSTPRTRSLLLLAPPASR
jgi:hypothetical protein